MERRLAKGTTGIWSIELRAGDPAFAASAAAELEEAGFAALWVPGGRGGDLLERMRLLLNATRTVIVASGILNIWMHEPREIGDWWRGLPPGHRDRVMLGLGVGHAPVIGEAWKKPLEKMSLYLDALDVEGLPAEARCIAALGPKMIDLARERAAGSHPYLISPEHSAASRERLGSTALLAPEQGVIFGEDWQAVRAKACAQLDTYAHLPNYRNSWHRLGFSDAEIDARDDRLLNALFAWGTPDKMQARAQAHCDAGADHVCFQVISGAPMAGDLDVVRGHWRSLATAAIGQRR